jgi:hypothetical protein
VFGLTVLPLTPGVTSMPAHPSLIVLPVTTLPVAVLPQELSKTTPAGLLKLSRLVFTVLLLLQM